MIVRESIKDVLKPKSATDVISAQNEILDDFLSIITNVIYLLKYVANDFQLNADNSDFTGFINIGIDIVDDPKLVDCIEDFIYLYYNARHTKHIIRIDKLLNSVNLYVNPYPNANEIIFSTKK